ncbi:MAG TPA: carboxypeptidase regulatory-like domain-containing protein, partial [Arachidicoccus sp.]
MRKLIVLLTGLFCTTVIFVNAQQTAESGSLTGTIVDTAAAHALGGATITLIEAKDTAKVRHILSDSKGKFSFQGVAPNLYILRISYLGYQSINRYIGVTNGNPRVDMGDIAMQQDENENATVTVTATIPTRLKGDTVQYLAGSYGVKPNATVADLLKKLPGVDVDKNGVITAQGEQVARVFVDGKRFFGSDPKLAVENFPKDIVERIEIFDGKSDQAELSGFDDGATVKTINIVTKPDERTGWFGRFTLGGGNDKSGLDDPL